ncbi:MAG: phosphoribosylamine--glycine ligase [Candidatus Eremiobacteraeota bacterium]|nr:phosphoribosylamine--glycine ligase [Candidatus Eremiobacteraeota bacterium]
MKILVVGNGAREDALSWRLARSASCGAIFAAPGNAGTASRGTNWNLSPTNGKALAERALEEGIDLVVVGPEVAIAAGVVDKLRNAGLRVFGPSRSSGRLESSKVFAKRFMERHGVPTARFVVVHSVETARKALDGWKGGVVVKADGLAAGKGVVVCANAIDAMTVLRDWYGAGKVPGGGLEVLLEERLDGREVSVFALSDGRAMVPIAGACDYKRAGDGDTGPNTGGMGAFSPPRGFPDDLTDVVRERIVSPVLRGLQAEGETYIGVLYIGIMWTKDGPYVIEFNVRFGDPETQVMMPRVTGDFAALLASVADGSMDLSLATLSPQACVGVVLASPNYPRESTELAGLNPDVALGDGAQAFWGNSAVSNGRVMSTGGRVLTVTAVADDLETARARAYESVKAIAKKIGTSDLTYRSDIAR